MVVSTIEVSSVVVSELGPNPVIPIKAATPLNSALDVETFSL